MAKTSLRAARTVTVFVAAAVLVAACGSAAPSASPSVAPTPLATPNPHLPSPATAKQVFAGLGKAGLSITANTATLGAEDSDVVTRIYATYLGWPLDVTEYRSATALTKAITWASGEAPGKGEPPAAIAGINILIIWGPTEIRPHAGQAERSPGGGADGSRGGCRRAPLAAQGTHQHPGEGRRGRAGAERLSFARRGLTDRLPASRRRGRE